MSRFSASGVIRQGSRRLAPQSEVQRYELEITLLTKAPEDDMPTGMDPADAIDYLKSSSGLTFPWYVSKPVTWDSVEQGEFNAKIILELFKSGHIVATRGGVLRTQIGDTTFIDKVTDRFTLDFKS